MLCEQCKKKEATVQIISFRDNKKEVKNLCSECVQKQKGRQSFSDFGFSPLFSSFFGDDFGFGEEPSDAVREEVDQTDLYSEETNKVLTAAKAIVKNFKNKNVNSEHLLLAIIQNKIGQKIFSRLKLSREQIRQEVENLIGKGKFTPTEVNFSPRAKRILEIAQEESYELGHDYIGPEHILIALIKEGEGLAADILARKDIDLAKIRSAVISEVGEGIKREEISKTPTLDQFSRDLTRLARQGKIDPVIGRTEEIQSTMEILSRRTKNNPVLVGEPGVGKTAIVEGLALKIVNGEVPETLLDKRIVALDLSMILAGTRYRGDFEERLRKIIEEVRENSEKIILFIDEMHTVVGAGSAEGGSMDASNMLKPALAKGELHMVGATTLDEYRKYVEKDAALERRFQPVIISEPTVGQTIEILRGLRDRYEAHHRVKISDAALVAAAELSDRYISDRFLPDKAIDLIDQASAKIRLATISEPVELKIVRDKIRHLESEKRLAEKGDEKKKAQEIGNYLQKLIKEREELIGEWRRKKASALPEVSVDEIAKVISKLTGVPVTQLTSEEKERLLKLEQLLHQRIIGQKEAVQVVSETIRRARIGLADPDRPAGSFLFLGPTGVGKTELAKALTETLFGSEDLLIRIDMSEYMEKHSVARLIGSPPGYVGYEEGGQLTEAVRRKPYSVILLDEIEKAYPEVQNLLLQILEDGRLTDGKGKIVNFKNTIIIGTSNLGAEIIQKSIKEKEKFSELKKKIDELLKTYFRPEFLNRIDEIIIFESLDKKQVIQIAELLLEKTKRLLVSQKIGLDLTSKAKEKLADLGFDPTQGARPLRRVIQKEIENKISSLILEGKFVPGDKIKVDFKKDRFVFKKVS